MIPLSQRDSTPLLISALFIIAKTWKQHKYPSMDEWVKESETHIHTHTHRNVI